MVDFAISNSGDLILEEQERSSRFRLDFRLAEFPGLAIKFFQRKPLEQLPPGSFKLTFDVKAHSKEAAYRAAIVEDLKEAAQRVIIQLRTELTELPARQTVGSKLRTVKHERLSNTANIANIEAMTLDAVKDIVSNAAVIAKPEFGVGTFYCQNVNVYIYSNDELFYKFSI